MRKTQKPEKATLPVPPDVRLLADETMAAGDYGTLTNTLRVALREQLKRLETQRELASFGSAPK